MVIGNTDQTNFEKGNHTSQDLILYTLFAGSSFLIIIHFLNMLIAIMGNTFAERTEVGPQVMIKDHLRFVMDNWILLRVAFPDIDKLEYIIAALNFNEEHDHESKMSDVKEDIQKIKNMIDTQFKKASNINKDS